MKAIYTDILSSVEKLQCSHEIVSVIVEEVPEQYSLTSVLWISHYRLHYTVQHYIAYFHLNNGQFIDTLILVDLALPCC